MKYKYTVVECTNNCVDEHESFSKIEDAMKCKKDYNDIISHGFHEQYFEVVVDEVES